MTSRSSRKAKTFCKSFRRGLNHNNNCPRYSIFPLFFWKALLSVFWVHLSVSWSFLRQLQLCSPWAAPDTATSSHAHLSCSASMAGSQQCLLKNQDHVFPSWEQWHKWLANSSVGRGVWGRGGSGRWKKRFWMWMQLPIWKQITFWT